MSLAVCCLMVGAANGLYIMVTVFTRISTITPTPKSIPRQYSQYTENWRGM